MQLRLILFISLAALLCCCNESPSKYIYNQGFVYGTIYNITYESPDGSDMQDLINNQFQRYTAIFSTYEDESTITRLNRNLEIDPEPEFIECFKKSIEISEITNGAFDITAGSLVNAWGFGPEEKTMMTAERVDSLMQFTGFEKIRLENSRFIKENQGIQLDMSAIAKGYTCDLIAEFLREKGCTNYMVEIGGEVVAKGINEKGKVWTIGISKPNEDLVVSTTELQEIIELRDHAMATSGNYRNFYEEDGKKFAHTIDPKTGYPVQHSLLSATVIANDCMTADAFATAFMVLGVETSIEIARQIPELQIYFVYADENGENQIYYSEGFTEYIME